MDTNKQKCEELRKIRMQMANVLGIPDLIRKEPCNFEGECNGTCPACYMEERALMDKLYELHSNGLLAAVYGDKTQKLKNEIDESYWEDLLKVEDILDGEIIAETADSSGGESFETHTLGQVRPFSEEDFGLQSPFRTDKSFINNLVSPFRTDKHKDKKG